MCIKNIIYLTLNSFFSFFKHWKIQGKYGEVKKNFQKSLVNIEGRTQQNTFDEFNAIFGWRAERYVLHEVQELTRDVLHCDGF